MNKEKIITLEKLLSGVEYKGNNVPLDVNIKDIDYNTTKAGEGVVFIGVSILGSIDDGDNLAKLAYQKGCRIFITENLLDLPSDSTQIIIMDARKVFARISANFFEEPAKKLKLIGVTGTSGKTTTTYMIQKILQENGKKAGVIGTLGAFWEGIQKTTQNTTPEPYETQKLLYEMYNDGCEMVAMEVSSLGLLVHRVDHIQFYIGVFTNISQDHIGGFEHKTYEEYYGCKKELFKHCDNAVGSIDDCASKDMLSLVNGKKLYFGIKQESDYQAFNIKQNLKQNDSYLGVQFDLKVGEKVYENIGISMPGVFNVYNALAAIAVCQQFKIEIDNMRNALLKVKVEGRVEPVLISDDYDILINYAHNGKSLKELLESIQNYNPKRIICLYGSVGDRAQIRRTEMGLISGKMCDLSILTSDDPNFEDQSAIIDEIANGVKQSGGNYIKIPEREKAIKYAIENLQKGDILILAGKGHEKFQKILGQKFYLDEKKCCLEALQERKELKFKK